MDEEPQAPEIKSPAQSYSTDREARIKTLGQSDLVSICSVVRKERGGEGGRQIETETDREKWRLRLGLG